MAVDRGELRAVAGAQSVGPVGPVGTREEQPTGAGGGRRAPATRRPSGLEHEVHPAQAPEEVLAGGVRHSSEAGRGVPDRQGRPRSRARCRLVVVDRPEELAVAPGARWRSIPGWSPRTPTRRRRSSGASGGTRAVPPWRCSTRNSGIVVRSVRRTRRDTRRQVPGPLARSRGRLSGAPLGGPDPTGPRRLLGLYIKSPLRTALLATA